MRVLLISDTHGHVDRIQEYAEHAKADVCIHAGDFGFYDDASIDGMNQRELYLQVKHSDLPEGEKTQVLKAGASVWEKVIKEHNLLGTFHEFLDGGREFGWPVYAIWGNHDDANVALRMIKKPIPYLHMLHDRTAVDLGEFVLLGLGGNCTPGKAFTQGYKTLPGARCRPTSVLAQYLSLLETARNLAPDKPKVLVTHVSPLVEPFLELLAWQIGATMTISGHMGYPDGETGETNSRCMFRLRETYRKLLSIYPAEDTLKFFDPKEKEQSIRHINLPDADKGYAILDWSGKTFSYEMRGKTFFENRYKGENYKLFDLCRRTMKFCVDEYTAVLPIAKQIISGKLTDTEMIGDTYERMLHTFGYPRMLELFISCCDCTKKTFPELTRSYLDFYQYLYSQDKTSSQGEAE